MDQTASENQDVLWNLQERRDDAALDCVVCVSASFHSQVQGQDRVDDPSDAKGASAYLVRKKRSAGSLQKKASSSPTQNNFPATLQIFVRQQ